jgi:2-polyprenyl-3-methyl-5-hydroxy-6-metoxy-1,4-benzoquinol methylase
MSYEDCNAVGGMTAYNWKMDPKRIGFQAARYKFVARMMEGKLRVLEVGCADGWGARIVKQHVDYLDAIDADAEAIAHAKRNSSPRWPISFWVADFMTEAFGGYDGVYALDVFEHVEPTQEHRFLERLRAAAPVCVIGAPSRESQLYASEISLREHVNCPTRDGLRSSMLCHWQHVFLFGMNDETLHTGFGPMSHYLLALGVA